MTYTPKHPDSVYLDHDPFEDSKCENYQKHHKQKLAKTRKEHLCCGNYMGTQHTIPSNTKVYFESCFLDGFPATSYYCLKCFDQHLEDLEYVCSD